MASDDPQGVTAEPPPGPPRPTPALLTAMLLVDFTLAFPPGTRVHNAFQRRRPEVGKGGPE
jgi:hypothetical protein